MRKFLDTIATAIIKFFSVITKPISKALDPLSKWMNESNRQAHIWGGIFLYTILYIVGAGWLTMGVYKMGIIATLAVLGAMIGLEIKDKDAGGKFDWQDILAGLYFPIIVDFLLLIGFIVGIIFP